MDFEQILDNCLERLARGETLEACLSQYPQQAAELRPLLAAAEKMETGTQVQPLPAFRLRARGQLIAHMRAHPRRAAKPVFAPLFRLAVGLATLLLAFLVTGTALAQSALPGEALYPWKLTSEQAWLRLSPDPPGAQLALAARRVDEALAVSDDPAALGIALRGYRDILAELAMYTDPAARQRIELGLQIQKERLKESGLAPILPAGEETPAPEPLLPLPTPDVELPLSTPEILPLDVPTLETPGLPLP